jgi:hypothetical protein
MTWEDVLNTYKDLGFRSATRFEKQQKSMKDYWSSRGLMGSSFYQDEYDDTNEAYNDYRTDMNSEFMDLNNERINAQARGELPEQVSQRQSFDRQRAELLAEQARGQKEQAARRLAAVQPSQVIGGQLIGAPQKNYQVKLYQDLNPWIYKYKWSNETTPQGWH